MGPRKDWKPLESGSVKVPGDIAVLGDGSLVVVDGGSIVKLEAAGDTLAEKARLSQWGEKAERGVWETAAGGRRRPHPGRRYRSPPRAVGRCGDVPAAGPVRPDRRGRHGSGGPGSTDRRGHRRLPRRGLRRGQPAYCEAADEPITWFGLNLGVTDGWDEEHPNPSPNLSPNPSPNLSPNLPRLHGRKR